MTLVDKISLVGETLMMVEVKTLGFLLPVSENFTVTPDVDTRRVLGWVSRQLTKYKPILGINGFVVMFCGYIVGVSIC